MVRTFEQRVAEVFTEQSPFKTVEEYTEWYLSLMAVELTKDAEKLEQTYRLYTSTYREVPMDELENQVADIISVVDSHLADFGNWEPIDADQFLTVGQEVETGYEVVIYKQGYARAI